MDELLESFKNEKSTSSANSSSNVHRFGNKSQNMFFVRHAAAPRNLRFIYNINGYMICSMTDNEYKLPPNLKPLRSLNLSQRLLSKDQTKQRKLTDPEFNIDFSSHSAQDFINSYRQHIQPHKRKQIILPPIPFWSRQGYIVDDTRNWRMELNNLGKKIGILTSEEINQETQRLLTLPKEGSSFDLNVPPKTSAFNRTFMSSSYDKFPKRNPQSPTSTRIKTGIVPKSSRFNEMRQTLTSRGRTKSAKTASKIECLSHEKCILCDQETDRELWLLRILTQILETESMQEVQSWLVSASHQQKEIVKELILKAVEGLNQAGRLAESKPDVNEINLDLINSEINLFLEEKKVLKKTQEKNQFDQIETNLIAKTVQQTNKKDQEVARDSENTSTIHQRIFKNLARLNLVENHLIQTKENGLENIKDIERSDSSQEEKCVEQAKEPHQQIESNQIENSADIQHDDRVEQKILKETNHSLVQFKFEKNIEKNYEILTLN